MLTICNEPVAPLGTLRSPRVWKTILGPDLPGKIVLAEIQLNHALVNEDQQDLDKRLLALYSNLIQRFGELHGEGTRCFLARSPESLNLIGHHIKEFGGATNGIACYETVFCVGPRHDGKVSISHLDARFGGVEFDLLDGLPKARVLDWAAHAKESRAKLPPPKGAGWTATVRCALQYYINRHKGPTGQIELPIPGLNIVVGSILPQGCAGHSETTLAAAALVSIMAASGEWGKLPLSEFAAWLQEAEVGGHGRRSEIGPVVFGMAGEVVHTDWNPARAKAKVLPHGFSFVTAHTGSKPDCAHPQEPAAVNVLKTPAVRSTTTAIGLALFRQAALQERVLLMTDRDVFEVVRQIPEYAKRADILKQISDKETRAELEARFKGHSEPAGGYNLREKLLFVLSEMRRAERAAQTIRAADATGLGALMNVGQAGEANYFHEVSALGQIAQRFALPSCVSDEEMTSLAENGEPLWKQTGRSGASSEETDLICDIATAVNGVLGARYCEPQRVAMLCKSELVQTLKDTLTSGYYTPRGLAGTAEQVYPCQGVGILAV